MKRRDFIAALGGAAASSCLWPLAARAQQTAKLPVVGFFHSEGEDASAFRVAAFRQGLNEAGYIEGGNVAVDYRWGEGRSERLPAIAAELIDRKVAVICAGDVLTARAARAVAGNTPIVFLTASDPVEDGLVASFNQPGGNATGIRIFSAGLVGKRLQLLHDLLPAAAAVGFLMNPSNPTAATQVKDVQAAAVATGLRVHVVAASDKREFDTAFATLAQQKVDALLVGADPRFNSQREQLIFLAARDRLPAVYEWRESAVAGGLMSYGTSLTDAFRNLGVYAGRILRGAKPSELPVMQQTRFELVINIKTAKTLGLTVPPTLLAQADEVIE
jgi:putative ABC transport system substrate-binding protein